MTQSTFAMCAPKLKPAERGKMLIDAWRQSGLSQATYARQHRIGTHLLVYWSKKFPCPGEVISGSGTAGQTEASTSATDFIQLPVTLQPRPAPAAPSHIEIRLASGGLVRVTSGVDHDLLKVVMQTLPIQTAIGDAIRQQPVKMLRRLRRGERRRIGRKADPSALIIDSQSVKASSSATKEVGYDAGKKIKGRKRHLLVDSQGNLIDVVVHAADIQDRDGAKFVLKRLASTMIRVRLIWADGGYRGKLLTWVRDLRKRHRITMRIVDKDHGSRGFAILPRRWVIERTNAWMVACRRLAREYERCTKNTEAFIRLAMIRLLMRRHR